MRYKPIKYSIDKITVKFRNFFRKKKIKLILKSTFARTTGINIQERFEIILDLYQV